MDVFKQEYPENVEDIPFESSILSNGIEHRIPGRKLDSSNVLEFIQQCAAELQAADVPSPRWVFIPGWMTDPRRSRNGRRSKKRVQKKKVFVPVFLKGTRWWKT